MRECREMISIVKKTLDTTLYTTRIPYTIEYIILHTHHATAASASIAWSAPLEPRDDESAPREPDCAKER